MGIFPGSIIIAAAALPCLLLIRFIYRFDKNKPEPRTLILKLFAAGLITPIVAALAELITVPLTGLFPPTLIPPTRAFLGIAVPEEIVKMAALVLVVRHRREFDEVMDGPVYGVTVAMGFALLENIMYVIGAGEPLGVALIRGFTAVPLHALAGGFMGLALARYRIESKGSLAGALILAVTIHGAYDWFLIDPRIPSGFIFPLLVIGWVVLLIALRQARKDDLDAGRVDYFPDSPGC